MNRWQRKSRLGWVIEVLQTKMLLIWKWWYFADRVVLVLSELDLFVSGGRAEFFQIFFFSFVLERLTSSNWHIYCHWRANESKNEQVEEGPKQRRRPDSHAGWMELGRAQYHKFLVRWWEMERGKSRKITDSLKRIIIIKMAGGWGVGFFFGNNDRRS